TPERMEMVDYTKAWLEGVKEVVVTGPGAPPVANLDDLGGKKVYIRRSSSFWEHLIRINEERRAAGRSEIVLDPADEDLEGEDIQKYQRLVEIFRKYADQYDMEYLMRLAQGYQESRLDQSARSPRGAVGIMQLLPSTASAPPISIRGVDHNADNNIHAGAKYL